MRAVDRRYAGLSFLQWLPVGLTMVPMVLLLLERGLTLAEVGALGLVSSLTLALAELPTGGLADSLGRRPVLVASAVAHAAGIPAYSAAKHGILGMTKAFAAELGVKGVTCNAIAPGYFETELNAELMSNADFVKYVIDLTPLRRWGKPEELAGAALFLASPAGSYVNGHLLTVDGGMTGNDWVMQFLADILDLPVERPVVTETTPLAAAYLAGLQAGVFASTDDIARRWQRDRLFEPRMGADQREALYAGWQAAVARVRSAAA